MLSAPSFCHISRSICCALVIWNEFAFAIGARLSSNDCNSIGTKVLPDCQKLPWTDIIGFIVLGCGGVAVVGYLLFLLGIQAQGCMKRGKDRRKKSRQHKKQVRGVQELANVPVYSRSANEHHSKTEESKTSRAPKTETKVGFSDEIGKITKPKKTTPLRSDVGDNLTARKAGHAHRGVKTQHPESDTTGGDGAESQSEGPLREPDLMIDDGDIFDEAQEFDDQSENPEDCKYPDEDGFFQAEQEELRVRVMPRNLVAWGGGKNSQGSLRGTHDFTVESGYDDSVPDVGVFPHEFETEEPEDEFCYEEDDYVDENGFSYQDPDPIEDFTPEEFDTGGPRDDYLPEEDEFAVNDGYGDPDPGLDYSPDEFGAGTPGDEYLRKEDEYANKFDHPDLVVDLSQD